MKQFTNTYNPQIHVWFDQDRKYDFGSIQTSFVDNKDFADIATLVKKMCPSVPMVFTGSSWSHYNCPAFYVQYNVRLCNGGFGFGVQVTRHDRRDNGITYELRLKGFDTRKGEIDLYLPTRIDTMLKKAGRRYCYIEDSNKKVVLNDAGIDFMLKIIDAMVTPKRRESIENMVTETAKKEAQEEMYHNLIDCELLEVMPEIRRIMHDKCCVNVEDPRDSGANKAITLFEGKYGRRYEITFTPTYMYIHYVCGNATDSSDTAHSILGLMQAAMWINKIEYDKYIKYEDKELMYELINRMCNMYNQCIHATYEPWGTASDGIKRNRAKE